MTATTNNIKISVRMLREAEEYLAKGDPIQSSEKLYKAAEEAVKALSALHKLPEHEEAVERGRWTAPLLFDAVEKLSEKVDPKIRDQWHAAWFLHVEGFHEARLTPNIVKARTKYIKELIELIEKAKQT